MGSLQLIDADSDRARRLTALLERQGWQVQSTTCALTALTAIEWNRPDLVLVHADLVGISAVGLCTTIKYDSTIEGVRVVLYAAPTPGDRASRTFDLTIATDRPDEVAASISHLDPGSARSRCDGVQVSEDAHVDLPRVAAGLRLDDVIESLTDAMLTGRLTISLRQSTTTHAIVFDRGRIIHSKADDQVGVDALRQLLRAGERSDVLWYQFEKLQPCANDHEVRSMDLSQPHELAVPVDDFGTQRIDPAEVAKLRRG